MKKFAIAVAAVAFACSASAQTLDHDERMVNRTAQKTATEVKKTLVAYFSATGTTEKAAGIIADRTGGVLYEIRPASGYTSADLDWTDSSSRSSREMHDPAARPEIIKDLKDADSYDIIYIGYPIWWDLAPRVINTFIDTYGFKSREEAEDFLTRKGVDIRRLFDGSYVRKLNSFIIGDAVYDKWCSRIKSVDFLNEFTDEERFDRSILTLLVDNLLSTANTLNLRDRMADSIAEYVNVVDIHVASESLIADLLASFINDFIMDFGYRYLSEDKIMNARNICMKRNLPAFNYVLRQMPATYDEDGLAELFTGMTDNPMAIIPSFDDNYNKWIEYMFISFVANLDIPEFDHEANQKLSAILEEIKSV